MKLLVLIVVLLAAVHTSAVMVPDDFVVDQDYTFSYVEGSTTCITFCPPPLIYVDGVCNPPVQGCEDPRWHFSKDSFTDGTGGPQGTNYGAISKFEIYGMAARHSALTTTFYINSNHPLGGVPPNSGPGVVPDGTIDFGDIFIDFSANRDSFESVNGTEDLWGIHFTLNSDANTLVPGLYKNVTVHSVFKFNQGHESMAEYENVVTTQTTSGLPGSPYGTPAYGDGAIEETLVGYFAYNKPAPTSIFSATRRISGLDYIGFAEDAARPENNPNNLNHIDENGVEDATDICDAAVHPDVKCINDAVDFENTHKPTNWEGKYTVGVRVWNFRWGQLFTDKAEYRACVAFECANDIICLTGRLGC